MLRKFGYVFLLICFLMVSGCKISGTVTDEDGVGVEGVTVTLTGKVDMETVTDTSGYYEFENNAISNGRFLVMPFSDSDTFYPVGTNVSGTLINVSEINFVIIGDGTYPETPPNEAGSPSFEDFLELLKRKAPDNGPIDTQVESWSILAPGVGGLGSSTCNLCIDQMYLYNDLIMDDVPLTEDLLSEYYKKGQVGLHGDSTFEKTPKAFYPNSAWEDLVSDFQDRGYDVPISYIPPKTLVARIDWDEHHVPHIVGDKVEDVTYGLGYATVHSNMFELLLIRLAGSIGILQMNSDLFDFSDPAGLFEKLITYKFLNYTRSEMMDAMSPIACEDQLGPLCQEVLSTLVAYRKGINQAMMERFPVYGLLDATGIPWPKWEVPDSVAAGLAITGVFGDPGGDQLSNLKTFRDLEARFGTDTAKDVFDDYKLRNVPVDNSTLTVNESFPNPVYADDNTGHVVDPDSIAWVDSPETMNADLLDVELPHASNWIIVGGSKTSSGTPLMVGGPQMGYIQPNIFLEFDARTTDSLFQITGVTLPGLHLAAFAGNAHNGAWTPTAAGGKTSDIFVEKLCSPDGDSVSKFSKFYMHNGECKPMRIRKYCGTPYTVHGPVVGWATVEGEPVAITKSSYHSEKMGQSIFPFYLLAKGQIKTANEFIDSMETFTLALNFAYINESEIAYINTGHYPVRAAGAQSDFPTWGTGEWDWQGVIAMEQRPHKVDPDIDYMASWNNQAAKDFYSSNGGFQRVQLLDQLAKTGSDLDLASLAEISRLASLQDAYAITFVPLLLEFISDLPEPVDTDFMDMVNALNDWKNNQLARRLDLDNDGIFDSAGPAIMDEIMICLKSVLQENLPISLGNFNFPNSNGSAYQDGTTSLILMLIKRAMNNEADALLTCGDGTYTGCQNLIVQALINAHANLIEQYETDLPSGWLKTAEKIELLIRKDETWHWQNRPTYQQVATVQQ